MQTMDFLTVLCFEWGKATLGKNNIVRKIVFDGLSKTLVRVLSHGLLSTVYTAQTNPGKTNPGCVYTTLLK